MIRDNYSSQILLLKEIFKRGGNTFQSYPEVEIRLQDDGFVIYQGPTDKVNDVRMKVKAIIDKGLT